MTVLTPCAWGCQLRWRMLWQKRWGRWCKKDSLYCISQRDIEHRSGKGWQWLRSCWSRLVMKETFQNHCPTFRYPVPDSDLKSVATLPCGLFSLLLVLRVEPVAFCPRQVYQWVRELCPPSSFQVLFWRCCFQDHSYFVFSERHWSICSLASSKLRLLLLTLKESSHS